MSMNAIIPNDLVVVKCFHGGTTLMMEKMRTSYSNNEKRSSKGGYALYNQSERNKKRLDNVSLFHLTTT